MVGGLVQHHQVGGAQQHFGQGKAGLFPTAEGFHPFVDHVAAKQEAAQQRPHLFVRPVGHFVVDGFQHGLVQIQRFRLVLLKVAGDDIVRPHRHRALGGGF